MRNTELKKQACLAATYQHIRLVAEYISVFTKLLTDRGNCHDDSKLEEPELSVFAEHQPALALAEYGSKEYAECLKNVQVAIDHHYAVNRHHPEHWPIPDDDVEEILQYINKLKKDNKDHKQDLVIEWLTDYSDSIKSPLNGMTLIDLQEMLADWRAATQRNKNGNIRKSIDINAKRYKMSHQLKCIFENTIRELFQD